MSKFDEFCDKMAALPFEEKSAMIAELSEQIVPVLNAASEDGISGLSIYTDFLLASVAADGKLAEEEFLLIKPLFDAATDKDISYDEAVAIFKGIGLENPENLKRTVDLMVDLIGIISEEAKGAIVTLCLLVCAIDGEISKEEKDWIEQLVDDNFGLTVMEQIDDFLTEAKTFVLGTTDGEQPRMRVLGFKALIDDRIYFTVGTFKDVYKQLQANPRCEILASVGADFLRWDGNAVFTDDPRPLQAAREAMPQVVDMYEGMGATLGFFTLEGGSAEIVNVMNKKTRLF